MRQQYHWDAELLELEKTMTHEAAALKIAGFDPIENDGEFECNACGETLSTDCMVAVVRGDVPVLCCLNCSDDENLPLV